MAQSKIHRTSAHFHPVPPKFYIKSTWNLVSHVCSLAGNADSAIKIPPARFPSYYIHYITLYTSVIFPPFCDSRRYQSTRSIQRDLTFPALSRPPSCERTFSSFPEVSARNLIKTAIIWPCLFFGVLLFCEWFFLNFSDLFGAIR